MTAKNTFFPHLNLAEEFKKARTKSPKKQKIYDCGMCGLDKEGCKTPRMPGVGNRNAKIMIVGEAGGFLEDERGIPFVGKSGQLLRRTLKGIGIDPEEDCFITNAVRCRPPSNNTPTSKQILCCNKFLIDEIKEVKPEILVITGAIPLEAIIGKGSISQYRGYTIPYQPLETILLPTFHPSRVLRDSDAFTICFKQDLYKLLNYKPYSEYDLNRYDENNTILTDPRDIEKLINRLKTVDKFAFDFETVGKKPYNKDSKLLICGVAISGKESYTFDVTEETFGAIVDIMSMEATKIIHHSKFEQMWGIKVVNASYMKLDTVHCTLHMSYVLNEQRGIHSLDAQAFRRLGLHKMKEADKYKNNMAECPYDLIHSYCGCDAKLEYRLDDIMWPEIEKDKKLLEVYNKLLIAGAEATMKSEMQGMVIDINKLNELKKLYADRIEKTIKKIHAIPEVIEFKEKRGKFNIRSPKDVPEFLREKLNIPVQLTRKQNYSVDKTFLETCEHDFCNYLREYRDLAKASSTYLKGIKNNIYDDGLLHANLNLHTTRTSRSSSDSPNLQNVDKRKHPEIRTIFTAPKGMIMLSADYIGAEVAGTAMVSGDKNLAKQINEGVDIHGYWAKKIFGSLKGDNRYIAKNRWVFPLIYLSTPEARAEQLGLSFDFVNELYNEFYDLYSGLREYQESTKQFYMRHGYVETPFGRRRRAPLKITQLINSIIQSLMSDFTLLSFIKLHSLNKYWIPIEVHDDIVMYTDFKNLKETYEEVKSIMEGWNFDFMNVKLGIDCKVGENWAELIDIKEML